MVACMRSMTLFHHPRRTGLSKCEGRAAGVVKQRLERPTRGGAALGGGVPIESVLPESVTVERSDSDAGRSRIDARSGWLLRFGSESLDESLPEVQIGDPLSAEPDREFAVAVGWAQGDGISSERLAQPVGLAAVVEEAALLDHANAIGGVVFDGRKGAGHRPGTGAITCRGRLHVQRLVRPLVVVDVLPRVEMSLRV